MASPSLPSSLVFLLGSQLRAPTNATHAKASLHRALPSSFCHQPHLNRTYASAANTPTPEDAQKARQQFQLRMTEKASRIKQNVGVSARVPAFANYIRPAEFSKRVPSGVSGRAAIRYHVADFRSSMYDYWIRWQLRTTLGKAWFPHFMKVAAEAYQEANKALATGSYDALSALATQSLIESIKNERLTKFKGLNLSWKLHEIVKQEIVCARQQELQKKGEYIAQIAVRFVTKQSLEVRNARGDLLKGRHDSPSTVTEYYVFQRETWKRREDWKIMKKMQEIDPFNPGSVEVQLV